MSISLIEKNNEEMKMTIQDIREFLISQQELTTQNLNDSQFMEQVALKQQFLIDNGFINICNFFGGCNYYKLDQIFRDFHKQKSQEYLDRKFNQDIFQNVDIIKSSEFKTTQFKSKDYKQNLAIKLKQSSKESKTSYSKQSLQKIIQFTQNKQQLSQKIRSKDAKQNQDNKENINNNNLFDDSFEFMKNKKQPRKYETIELNKQSLVDMINKKNLYQSTKFQQKVLDMNKSEAKLRFSYENPLKTKKVTEKVAIFKRCLQEYHNKSQVKSEQKQIQKNVFTANLINSAQKQKDLKQKNLKQKNQLIHKIANNRVSPKFINSKPQFNIQF